MSSATPAAVTNRLLEALPVAARQSLLKQCERVTPTFGDYLYEQAAPLAQVYFPMPSVISLIATGAGVAPLDAGPCGHG